MKRTFQVRNKVHWQAWRHVRSQVRSQVSDQVQVEMWHQVNEETVYEEFE